MEPLSAAASIITVLETSIKVFGSIIAITTSIAQYSERTSKVIQQCRFDADTLRDLLAMYTASSSLIGNEEYNQRSKDLFFQLQLGLFNMKARIEPYQEKTFLKQLKWSLGVEKAIVELENDMFRWSQRLHIRLSLLLPQLRELQIVGKSSALLQKPEILSSLRMREIVEKADALDGSSLRIDPANVILDATHSQVMGSLRGSDGKKFMIEFRAYDSSGDLAAKKAAEEGAVRLACILSNAQPALMNILRCAGYYHDPQNYRFVMLFDAPVGVASIADFPRLSDLMEGKRGRGRYSLTKRFEIARRVAAAVLVTHAVGWIHKTIQTQNVVLCYRGEDSGEAYLTGFEEARDKYGISKGTGSEKWEENIYRHPDRQAESGNIFYTPAYDIYSLGVVLLEIARWKTLHKDTNKKNGKFVFENISPPERRKVLLEKFLPEISHYVGDVYSGIVYDCLTVERGPEIRLMEHILARLEQLSGAV